MLSKLVRRYNFGVLKDSILNQKTDYGNVTPKIAELAERQLYKNPYHPLGIIKKQIEQFFISDQFKKGELQQKRNVQFGIGDNFGPLVTTKQNFDDLCIPKDHVSRKRSDTYYVTDDIIMRPHVTANEKEMFQKGHEAFLIFADCFRRDEIDATHYPVFHQMEAVRAFKPEDFDTDQYDLQVQYVMQDMQTTYENLVRYLFGNDIQLRWSPDYFPFTEPSMELEIYWKDQWIEMLGCGILRREVMRNFGRPDDEIAWASGCGLERLALLLFDITDIRLFWSQDPRFLTQFQSGEIVKFQPFSKYPSCYKDMSFYIQEDKVNDFEENDFYEIIRGLGGDLIEKVDLVDEFHNKKINKVSKCFRIHYRSLEKTLTNQEIDDIQFKIRDMVQDQLKVELR